MDWSALQQCIKNGNTTDFLKHLTESLQTGNKRFGILQKGLRTHCYQQVSDHIAREFVCKALLQTTTDTDAANKTPVAHLLLETAPQSKTDSAPFPTATQLFSTCCCAQHARLAVKVANVFAIKWTDVEDQQQCAQFVQSLLQDSSLLTPAVGLLVHFPQLNDGIYTSEVLEGLVEEGQLGLAQRWAATLPEPFQTGLVNYCVACDRLKEAVKLVRHLNLQQTFPDIDEMYKQRTLTRLLEKEQWAVAATYAGQDVQCQEQVVRAMALAGESALAEETREQFGLSRETLDINSAEAAAQRALTADTYLPLRLPANSVLFIDSEAAISRCQEVLQNAQVVGLDVEWKPNTSGEQNPASILQVATHSTVLLIDMIKLHKSSALDKCLCTLLQDAGICKLGCRLSDDINQLHRSYPDMEAFQSAEALLDLTSPWTLCMQEHNDQELQGRRRGAAVGLSAMAQSVLGKPLNKGMQMSDWERRPLSSKQLEYAALDAFVLLEIYDVISHPNQGLSQAQLGLSMYSYSHQKWRRNSSKGLLPDDVPERQQHAKQLDNEPAVPAILPASLSTARNHSTRLSSTASARSGDGQYATGHAMLHSTAGQQEGREEQLHIDQAVAMTEGSPLQECLQRHGLQTAVRSHPTSGAGSLATAASAAAALHVPQSRIANSLAFLADRPASPSSSTPVVLVVRGNQRVDMRKVTDHLGCSRRALKAATSEQCCRLFGYPPGVLPPCGHACTAVVLVDQGLQPVPVPSHAQPNCQAAGRQRDPESASEASLLQPLAQQSCTCATSVGEMRQMTSPKRAYEQAQELQQSTAAQPPLAPEHRSSQVPSCPEHLSQPQGRARHPSLELQAAAGNDLLYCGAGQANAFLAVSFDQLLLLSNGQVMDLVQSGDSGQTQGSELAQPGTTADKAVAFLLDSMCGRLCRWLRCVGMDTELLEGNVPRSQVAALSLTASRQGRMFLTRDHKLAEQRGLSAVYLLAADDAKEQFRDIQKRFGIRVDKKKLLSRCSQCNSARIAKVDKTAIQDVVDSKVLNYVARFWQCQDCKKVFWVGPKSDAAIQNMLRLMLDEEDKQ